MRPSRRNASTVDARQLTATDSPARCEGTGRDGVGFARAAAAADPDTIAAAWSAASIRSTRIA